MMGLKEEGESGRSQPSRSSRSSQRASKRHQQDDGDEVAAVGRASFVDQVVDTATEILPVPTIKGFDARTPGDRQSRTSNVASFLSALGGGHQTAFLFDPADRAANDLGAARRQEERLARSSSQDGGGGGSGLLGVLLRPSSASKPRGVSLQVDAPPPVQSTSRSRAASSPQTAAADALEGGAATSRLTRTYDQSASGK